MADPPSAESIALVGAAQIAAAADAAARRHAMAAYRAQLAPHTRRRHDADLRCFQTFLQQVHLALPLSASTEPPCLAVDPATWQPITFGLVTAFRQWMLQQRYAIGSINVRLATVRTYARLAHQAGTLTAAQYLQIKNVTGFAPQVGRRLDQQRQAAAPAEQAEPATRRGAKKAAPHILSPEQITLLLEQPPTQAGLRDTLILGLLAEHGLRCSEVAALTRADLQPDGTLVVMREKTNLRQRLALVGLTRTIIRTYCDVLQPPPHGLLLAAIDKHDHVRSWGMSAWSVRARVRLLGKHLLGISNLSPHDLRHSWATQLAREGIPLPALRDAGGWRTLTTPGRYIAEQAIANEGVITFRTRSTRAPGANDTDDQT